jgi:farnesyl diphosphate synthase
MLAVNTEMPNQKRSTENGTSPKSKKIKQSPEIQDFLQSFDVIAKELIESLAEYKLPQNGIDWLKKMIYETIPGGKMNRGLTVASSLGSILKRPLTEKEKKDAHILGNNRFKI